MKKAKDEVFKWRIDCDIDFLKGIRRIYELCKSSVNNATFNITYAKSVCAIIAYNMILYAKKRTNTVVNGNDVFPEPATKKQLNDLMLVYNEHEYDDYEAKIIYGINNGTKSPFFKIQFSSSEVDKCVETSFVIRDLRIFDCINTRIKIEDFYNIIYDNCIFEHVITHQNSNIGTVIVPPEEEKRYLKRKAFRETVDDIAYGAFVGTCTIAIASLGIIMIKGLVDMFKGEGGIEPSDIV